MTTAGLPRLLIVNCGGTIASLGTSNLDVLDYPDEGRKLPIADIIARVPEILTVADPELQDFRAIGSSAMTGTDWLALRALIQARCAAESGIAGVVVLHGTGSLEETAFFLHLTLDIAQTVVLVGAQRPLSAIGSDAPINLFNAVRVAADPNARGRGVLVVLNDEIHSARDVVKASTYRVQAFRSADFGMLGVADGDGVHFFRTLDRPHTRTSPFASLALDVDFPRVDILYAHVGADAVFIDAAIAAGAKGLVSAGFAPGLVPPAAKSALEKLADQGLPIVVCSRAASGRIAPRRYVATHRMVAGQDLSPQKARILLMLCVARRLSLADIQATFAAV